ncbi:hypothetical protein SGI36_21365, partial [Providencia rettgeri]
RKGLAVDGHDGVTGSTGDGLQLGNCREKHRKGVLVKWLTQCTYFGLVWLIADLAELLPVTSDRQKVARLG